MKRVVLCLAATIAGSLVPHRAEAQQTVALEKSAGAEPGGSDDILAHHVTVNLTRVSRRTAIDAAAASAKITIQYQAETIDAVHSPVSVRATDMPLRQVLDLILAGTTLVVVTDGQSHLAIVGTAADPQQGAGIVIGTVVDAHTNEPIAGVTIRIKDLSKGAVPTLSRPRDGRFTFTNVAAGSYVLVAQRLGYLAQERRVTVIAGDTARVQFQLAAMPAILQGIVTTGAGDRAKLEVGNAISTINADSVVRTTPIRNVSDLIKGRASGVDVLTTGGTVGAGSKIRIRGLSSMLTSEDPIVIVDGVRFDAAYTRPRLSSASGASIAADRVPAQNSASLGSTIVPATSRLDDIDPESIESLEVLKGPAASALYGSDAANGVIVIKTKHGRPGPTRWTLSGQTGWSTMQATFPESYYGWGRTFETVPSVTTCTLALVASLQCEQDSTTHFNPLNSSATSPFNTGRASQVNGQVSGGTDRLQYFVSSTYDDEIGMLGFPPSLRALTVQQTGNPLPSWAEQPNVLNSLAMTSTLSSQFKNADLALSVNGRRQYHRDVPEGSQGVVGLSAYYAPGYQDTLTGGWGGNAPASNFLTRNDDEVTRGYGSLSGSLRPIRFLTIHATGGVDYSLADDQLLLAPADVLAGDALAGNSRRNRTETTTLLNTVDANATLDVPVTPMLDLRTTGGTQYTSAAISSLAATASGLQPGSTTVNGATSNIVAEFNAEQATAGWYLQETASLNQRLFVTVAIRGDASSAFGGEAKSVNYPKWNASWLVSQEPFFPRVPLLNSLRFRVGYGHAGAQPSFDARFRTYQFIPGSTTSGPGNTIDLNSVGNSAVLPERSVETEGGFDLGFADDRVTLGVTMASKDTRDALVNRTLPPSFGQGMQQVQNIGKISNRNLEVEATVRPIVSSALSWSSTVLLTHTRNRVVSLGPSGALPTTTVVGGAQSRFVAGYPVDGLWARAVTSYGDVNGDGILEPNEVRLTDSVVYAGQSSPTHRIGWQNGLSLFSGRLSIGANFTYEGGGMQYNSVLSSQCRIDRCRGAVDPTASLAQQVLAVTSRSGPQTTAWPFLERVSVFRFEELSLTVEAPAVLARALRSQRATFSLMGRNLNLWSHYRGADPDVNSNSAVGDGVTDAGTIPQPRSWTLRVNLDY